MCLDIGFSNTFLDLSPQAMKTKVKIRKLCYIEVKVFFCTGKKAINKMKRTPTEWEKIFANKKLKRD